MIPAGEYLLFGKTGAGKSSLINTISQVDTARTSVKYACTKTIETYSFSTPAGSYLIHDTPGLCEDEDRDTDQQYLSSILDFLINRSDETFITVLYVVRSDTTRFRSEDTEVIRGLAQILSNIRLPVMFVATNFSFATFDITSREFFNRLRIQHLIALDSELLLLTQGRCCAEGFSGSYGVDNVYGIWFDHSNQLFTPCDEPLTELLESSLGHNIRDLRIWVHRSGHDPSHILNGDCFEVFTNRIVNLCLPLFRSCEIKGDFTTINPSEWIRFCNSFPRYLSMTIPESELLEVYDDDYHLELRERTIFVYFKSAGSEISVLPDPSSRQHIPLDTDRCLASIKTGVLSRECSFRTFLVLRSRGFLALSPGIPLDFLELPKNVANRQSELRYADCFGNTTYIEEYWDDLGDRTVDYGSADDSGYRE